MAEAINSPQVTVQRKTNFLFNLGILVGVVYCDTAQASEWSNLVFLVYP